MNATEFLRRRKDRSAAIILSVLDREVPDRTARERIRKVVLDQLNDHHAATLDVIQSLDNGTVVLNDHYLQKLEEVHDAIVGNGHG